MSSLLTPQAAQGSFSFKPLSATEEHSGWESMFGNEPRGHLPQSAQGCSLPRPAAATAGAKAQAGPGDWGQYVRDTHTEAQTAQDVVGALQPPALEQSAEPEGRTRRSPGPAQGPRETTLKGTICSHRLLGEVALHLGSGQRAPRPRAQAAVATAGAARPGTQDGVCFPGERALDACQAATGLPCTFLPRLHNPGVFTEHLKPRPS